MVVYYKHNLSPKYIFPVHTRSGSIQLSRGLCEFSQTFCPFWLCFVALISKDVSFHWGKEELSSGGSTAVSLNHSNSWMSVVLWHRRLNRRINRMHYSLCLWEPQTSCQHVVGRNSKHKKTLVMHFHGDVEKAIRPIIPSPQPVGFSPRAQINWLDSVDKCLSDLAVI